jgi:hypothetical protein
MKVALRWIDTATHGSAVAPARGLHGRVSGAQDTVAVGRVLSGDRHLAFPAAL